MEKNTKQELFLPQLERANAGFGADEFSLLPNEGNSDGSNADRDSPILPRLSLVLKRGFLPDTAADEGIELEFDCKIPKGRLS